MDVNAQYGVDLLDVPVLQRQRLHAMGRHSTAIVPTPTLTPPLSPSKKRKRDEIAPQSELEVDVLAPEPASKKALRKARKVKPAPEDSTKHDAADHEPRLSKNEAQDSGEDQSKSASRSEFGIWIGNLPWTFSKSDVRAFFVQNADILEDQITRLHMPTPNKFSLQASQQRIKPQNKGFAYVDFSTKTALRQAIGLSEKLVSGRRVLIKDAKSFEGRPEPIKNEASTDSRKPPSRRIFVGNLGFDSTKDGLQEHFGQCGQVVDVHVATFEDSGKCKGYAWVEFQEVTAAEAAVRGWYMVDNGSLAEDGHVEDLDIDAKPMKKPRQRKWWVNQIQGRPLRMEFAEDKVVRYKKRFGKDAAPHEDKPMVGSTKLDAAKAYDRDVKNGSRSSHGSGTPHDRKQRDKFDSRKIKPGAALAAAPRASGAIVESLGKKITFD